MEGVPVKQKTHKQIALLLAVALLLHLPQLLVIPALAALVAVWALGQTWLVALGLVVVVAHAHHKRRRTA